MNEEQYKALVAQVGEEAAKKLKAEAEALKTGMEQAIAGKASAEDMEALKKKLEDGQAEIKGILEKQGMTMQEALAKMNPEEFSGNAIAEQLKKDSAELAEIYNSGNRSKQYIITLGTKGQPIMKPFDVTKAAGPHATVNDVTTPGNLASITQSIDASTILRMGADATIVSAFRNTPWLLDLVNTINAGFSPSFYLWMDEIAKEGSAAAVPEGGTKPPVQYRYELKSAAYKKVAALVSFTEEFTLDFERLQSEILNVAQMDLKTVINSAILANLKAAAVAYNTGAAYQGGEPIVAPNDWDAIAAMAAQVEQNTYAARANAAIVSTMKKYRMGTLKDAENRWLGQPGLLSDITIASNPEMGAQDVIVGDLKQYNVALRGGIIVRVGYNGTDFAENKFSTVLEQFYFDYISNNRKPAIVKGPTFPDVKAAISA